MTDIKFPTKRCGKCPSVFVDDEWITKERYIMLITMMPDLPKEECENCMVLVPCEQSMGRFDTKNDSGAEMLGKGEVMAETFDHPRGKKECPLKKQGCPCATGFCSESWFIVCGERAKVQVGFGTKEAKLEVHRL